MSFVFLVVWIVYAYRDIWPLATYTLVPADASEGWILWAELSALTLAGIVVPLITPRRRNPVGKQVRRMFTYVAFIGRLTASLQESEPNPEQTASLLSLVTYGFVENFIWKASRMTHCPFDMLPPLADYDGTDYLVKRSFRVRSVEIGPTDALTY